MLELFTSKDSTIIMNDNAIISTSKDTFVIILFLVLSRLCSSCCSRKKQVDTRNCKRINVTYRNKKVIQIVAYFLHEKVLFALEVVQINLQRRK